VEAAHSDLLKAHFDRHRAESGRGDIHFMPFAPDDPDGPRGLDAEGLARPLDEPAWQRWFAAWSEKEIVGHVDLKGGQLKSTLHRCELGIGIERHARGVGLGRALMRHAIDYVQAIPGLDWLDLRTFGHNTPARALYQSLGFVEVGRVEDFIRIENERIDDVLMTLPVSG
jgi:RimJ/RimL family protein N-acetyltransferase